MHGCEANSLASPPHLALRHRLRAVVPAEREGEAAALLVLALRVDWGPLSPLSSLPWGALLRRAVRRAGNALRDGSGAAVKRVVAVAELLCGAVRASGSIRARGTLGGAARELQRAELLRRVVRGVRDALAGEVSHMHSFSAKLKCLLAYTV